jgi:glycosyltransferase involved in cell wall biosynthesis
LAPASETERALLLFVEPSVSRTSGGSRHTLLHLLRHLDRTSFDAHVVFATDGPLVAETRRLGLVADVLPRAFSRRGSSAPRALRDFLWRDRREGRRLDRELDPAIRLICFNGNLIRYDWAWYHLARRRRIPLVICQRGLWARPFLPFLWVGRRCDRFVCVADDRVERLRPLLGARPYTVIPPGIDRDRLRPARAVAQTRAALGHPEGIPFLLTVSHFTPWKGQLLAVRAAALLAERGVGARWYLIGETEDADYRRQVEREVERSGLGDRVVLLPGTDAIADVYAAADLAVHTAVQPEPYGRTVAEALLSGLPVVVPDEGTPATLIAAGGGRVYRAGDADRLASVLEALLRDSSSIERLRSEALDAAARLPSEADVVARWHDLFRSLSAATADQPPRGAQHPSQDMP